MFRLLNPVVDDWEGRVNAWPLDEGLIDYVDASHGGESELNALYTANVIGSDRIEIGGQSVDVADITPVLLETELQDAGGVEANVATGSRAIEFLLWGQDLNGTEAGACEDFTHGHCARLAEYLTAASALLVDDLEEMAGNWGADGAAWLRLAEADPAAGLSAMLTGMGSLSYGEPAGERTKLGLLLHDPEEEHVCFSDTTHVSHLYDAVGIRTAYLGRYEGPDGEVTEGPSLSGVVTSADPGLGTEMRSRLDEAVAAMQARTGAAEGGESHDQRIAAGNEEGNARVQTATHALIARTRSIERVMATLDLGGVTIEGSDSLDEAGASSSRSARLSDGNGALRRTFFVRANFFAALRHYPLAIAAVQHISSVVTQTHPPERRPS